MIVPPIGVRVLVAKWLQRPEATRERRPSGWMPALVEVRMS